MPSKRVLMVGPVDSFKPSCGPWLSARSGLMFYSFAHRLANGFIRNGHFVVTLNDRDSRKHAFGSRAGGAWLANRRLLHMAREVRPDLLCLQHCDLISSETIVQVKKLVPHCRVAVVYYDSIISPPSAERLRRFLEVADIAFVTTAGRTLARFAEFCPVAFIPNPIDLSIDHLSAYAVTQKNVDVFFAGGADGTANRWPMVDELRRQKPELRYALYGRDKKDRLLGDAYYQAIKQAKVGLNFNRDEGDLYASDRMAQYLGNGLLLATSRQSGYQDYFSDEEMIFFDDVADLGDKVKSAISDDRRWRLMAERGRAKAHLLMGGQLVTDFIMRMAFGWDEPRGWPFNRDIYLRPLNEDAAHSISYAQRDRATIVPPLQQQLYRL